MKVLIRKWKLIVSLLIAVIIAGIVFNKKIYIMPNACYDIPNASCDGFYPWADKVVNSAVEYVKLYTDIAPQIAPQLKALKEEHRFDFDKYTYVLVYGAKVKNMYISLKSTLLEDFGVPRAYRQGKFWLRINYGEEDNKMHLYRIDKRKYVIGTRMDEDGG